MHIALLACLLICSINAMNIQEPPRTKSIRRTREPPVLAADEIDEIVPPAAKRQKKVRTYKNKVEGKKLWRRGHSVEVKRRVVCLRAAGLTSIQVGILTGLKETTISGIYNRHKNEPEIKCSDIDAAEFLKDARKEWAANGRGYLATKSETPRQPADERVSFAVKKKIVCLRLLKNLDFHDIAEQLALKSFHQVSNIFQRYKDRFTCKEKDLEIVDEQVENVDKRAGPYSQEMKERVVCLYKARVTFVDLEKIYNIKYHTLRSIYRSNKNQFECSKQNTNRFLAEARKEMPGLKLYKYKKKKQMDELEQKTEKSDTEDISDIESSLSDSDEEIDQVKDESSDKEDINESEERSDQVKEENVVKVEKEDLKSNQSEPFTLASIFDDEANDLSELVGRSPVLCETAHLLFPSIEDLEQGITPGQILDDLNDPLF